MNSVNIAFGNYDKNGTYSRHIGVAMASVMYNSTLPVCCHILHDETLTDDNRQNFVETAKNIGNRHSLFLQHKVKFVDVSEYYSDYTKDLDELCGVFSKGMTFYFTLPEAIHENKVIVLDGDTVTNLDISKLWATDMGNSIVAATHDVQEYSIPGIVNQKANCYFNSGVLLLNLEKMRTETETKGTLLSRGLKYFRDFSPKYPDQDFMNYEYYGRVHFLDRHFDMIEHSTQEDLAAEKIWHFCGRKPWNEPIGSNVELLYWKYLAKTAWCDSDNILDLYYDMLIHSGYLHVHTSDCIAKIKSNAKREFKRIFDKR